MPAHPNILLMMADDHRHDAMHNAGDPTVQTPTMDTLCAAGVTFRRTHIMGGCSGAVCVPTRAALHTGCNPLRAIAGRQQSHNTIDPALALLPETLRQAGYHTFFSGKWHNDKASFARCFAEGNNIFFGGMSDHDKVPLRPFDPSGVYPDDAVYMGKGFSTEMFSNAAIDFLRGYNDDAPFFVCLAFTSPHDPRTAPPPYDTMYDPAGIPVPPNFLPEHPFDNGDMRLRDEVLDVFPRTHEIVQRHMADYYGMITHQDEYMGRVLTALEEAGHAENTIVVYTGDHGLSVGQHGLLGKQSMYDHSIRIPCIMRGPNLPAGKEVDALTHQIDIFPTLCDLADIPIPDTVEGQSLRALAQGETTEGRATVFAMYKDIQRTVSDGNWKLIRYYEGHNHADEPSGTERSQLFNLADDPWEIDDLSADIDHQEQVRQMMRLLQAWQAEVGDFL